MATVIIIVKIMPDEPQADLHQIKENALHALQHEGAKNLSFEEKPLAFGLKSLHVKMDMPEERGTDVVETVLGKIPHVSSVAIEDYRRAFG